MFELVVVVLYAVGAVLAGLFCVSWFPLAIHARLRGTAGVSTAGIFDYAGVQLVIFVTFAVLVRAMVLEPGYPAPPDDVATGTARILLVASLDTMVALRLYRWARELRRARTGQQRPDPFLAMSDGG